MKVYTEEQSIARLNDLGRKKRAFIFIIDYSGKNSYIEEIDRIDPSEVLYDFNGYSNYTSPCTLQNAPILWNTFPESFESYNESFNIVKTNILSGNSFLANLTCQTPIETNLSLTDIFSRSKALYKLYIKDHFVVFSPEIFIRINGNQISSYPMKGTIDATLPHARALLLDDVKESAEHATIVDLIRNDLSMVSKDVSVKRYRYVDTLKTNEGSILQTSSEIVGQLPENYPEHLGEIIFKLLPAGSITGAPKVKTKEIIHQAEKYDRGFYTGIAGYYDGHRLDSAVMIRFIEQKENQLYFKSGGGITFQSEAESEYHEMKQKVYVPIY